MTEAVKDNGLVDSPGEADHWQGNQPWIVISIAEIVVLNSIALFIYGCCDWNLITSPRLGEFFGWAQEPLRFWLLNLCCAASVGLILTGLPLVVYFSLPRGIRMRFPLRIQFGGTPPLVGAALFSAFGVLCIVTCTVLASFED